MGWRLRLSMGVLAICAAAGLAAAPATPASLPTGLRSAMEQLVAMKAGPPGVAVTIHRGHHPRFHTAGVADLKTGSRWRRTDHMRLGSVAKAFNGATALALVRRHKLRLGDTIGKLLPFLPKAWHRVTLAEALQHTSGLPNYTKDESLQSILRRHPHRRFHPRELLRFVRNKGLEFRPGAKYEYSNSDNIVAGLMIEAATGHSYVHELRRLVLNPLQLHETSLPVGAKIPHPYVRGYDNVGPPLVDISHALGMSFVWAAGGIVSSPREVDRFIRAYVGGRLFGNRLHNRQLRFRKGGGEPRGPGHNSVGLAIFRWRTPCGTVFGHTGNFPGYTQIAASTRNGQRSMTVSINMALSEGTGSPAVYDAYRHVVQLAVCATLR